MKTMDDWMVVNEVKLLTFKVFHLPPSRFNIEITNKSDGSKKFVDLDWSDLVKINDDLKVINPDLPQLPNHNLLDPNICWFGFNLSSNSSNIDPKLTRQLENYFYEAQKSLDSGVFESVLFSQGNQENFSEVEDIPEIDYCELTLKNIEKHLIKLFESQRPQEEQELLQWYAKEDSLIEEWKKVQSCHLSILSYSLPEPLRYPHFSSHIIDQNPSPTFDSSPTMSLSAEQLEDEVLKLQLKQFYFNKHQHSLKLNKQKFSHISKLITFLKQCVTGMERDKEKTVQGLNSIVGTRYHNLQCHLTEASVLKIRTIISMLHSQIHLALLSDDSIAYPLGTRKYNELLKIDSKLLKSKLKLNSLQLSDIRFKRLFLKRLILRKKKLMQSIRPMTTEDLQTLKDAGNDETKDIKNTKTVTNEKLNVLKNELININEGVGECRVEEEEDDDVPFIFIDKNQGDAYEEDNNTNYINPKDNNNNNRNDNSNNNNNNEDINIDSASHNTITDQYNDQEKNETITRTEEDEEDDGGDDDDFGDRLMEVAIANMQEQVGALEKQVCVLACQSARVRVSLKDHKLSKWIERLAEKLSKLNRTSVNLNSISDDIPPPPPLPPLPTYPSNDSSTFSSTNPSINPIHPLSIQPPDCASLVSTEFQNKKSNFSSSSLFRVTVSDLASVRSRLKSPTSHPSNPQSSPCQGYDAVLQEALLKIRDVLKEKDDDDGDFCSDDFFSDYE